jgi:hypothetical protein
MKLHRIIPVFAVTVMALVTGSALSAFQVEDTTTTVTKKAKKAKKAAKDATDATANSATSATETVKKAAVTPQKMVSDSEIAAAKASGKVWVNTDTGVYHKGGQWYGATKQGKFMTPEEATKAGYRAAKTQ